jgi:hypothetical protein
MALLGRMMDQNGHAFLFTLRTYDVYPSPFSKYQKSMLLLETRDGVSILCQSQLTTITNKNFEVTCVERLQTN